MKTSMIRVRSVLGVSMASLLIAVFLLLFMSQEVMAKSRIVGPGDADKWCKFDAAGYDYPLEGTVVAQCQSNGSNCEYLCCSWVQGMQICKATAEVGKVALNNLRPEAPSAEMVEAENDGFASITVTEVQNVFYSKDGKTAYFQVLKLSPEDQKALRLVNKGPVDIANLWFATTSEILYSLQDAKALADSNETAGESSSSVITIKVAKSGLSNVSKDAQGMIMKQSRSPAIFGISRYTYTMGVEANPCTRNTDCAPSGYLCRGGSCIPEP